MYQKAQQPLVRIESNFGNEKSNYSAVDHEKISAIKFPLSVPDPLLKNLWMGSGTESDSLIKILA